MWNFRNSMYSKQGDANLNIVEYCDKEYDMTLCEHKKVI